MCSQKRETSKRFGEDKPELGFECVKFESPIDESNEGVSRYLECFKHCKGSQSLPRKSLWLSCEMEPREGESPVCPTPCVSTQEPQKPVSLEKN